MNQDLLNELGDKMSLIRLSKTGLFRRMDTEGFDLVRRELILHRSVLDHALLDWFSENPEIKKDVDDWLDLSNIDFIESCERAHLPPEKVYETFQAVRKILKGDNAKFKKVTRKRD